MTEITYSAFNLKPTKDTIIHFIQIVGESKTYTLLPFFLKTDNLQQENAENLIFYLCNTTQYRTSTEQYPRCANLFL